MTCITAVECSDGAIIAGDYCGSNGFTRRNVTQSKVFKHSDMLFGYTGTFRYGQILEVQLDDGILYPPKDADHTYKWLISNFIPSLMGTLKDNKYDESIESIIVINSQVWEIQNDLSIIRGESGIASVGSGQFHSQASIHTQIQMFYDENGRSQTVDESKPMIEQAYKTVSNFVPNVSEKFNYLEMKI